MGRPSNRGETSQVARRLAAAAYRVSLIFWLVSAVGGQRLDSELRDWLGDLGRLDVDARAALEESLRGDALRVEDGAFACYPTPEGDLVSRVFTGGGWSDPVPITEGAARRAGERWESPRLAVGPDGRVWLAYVSQLRRRVFLHPWLGQDWGPRVDGPVIHQIQARADGRFDEELRPIDKFVLEGSLVHEALLLRLTSSDSPPVVRVQSIPLPKMSAVPGGGSLFIDALDVGETRDLEWVVEDPRMDPATPVLQASANPDSPDSIRAFNRGTVRLEEGLFRMWYAATGRSPSERPAQWQSRLSVCYAESQDGVHWTRPELGLAEYLGSKRNNRLPELVRLPIVVYDEREMDPERRYKCWDKTGTEDFYPEMNVLYTSPDGLRWRRDQAAPRSFPGARMWFMEFQSVFRDDREPNPDWRWKAYGHIGTGPLRRACHLTTSPDGVAWTSYPENPIIDPLQGVGEYIHDLVVWPEMGRYIGLVQVADERRNYELELVVSRDGVRFSRVADGRIFLGRIGESGGVNSASPVRVGDEWWFYHGRFESPWTQYPHLEQEIWGIKQHCYLAKLGVGRYAGYGLRRESVRGELTTLPIHARFDRELGLSVNGFTGVEGEIRVAVLDAGSSEPIPGYTFDECLPIRGDSPSLRATWRQHRDIGIQRDHPIRLAFQVEGDETRLYGFQWLAKQER